MNTAKINVNGKEYTLLFGYTCYVTFITRCFMFKDTYLTDDGNLTGLGTANLLHSAYLSNCYDKGYGIILRYDDFAEWYVEQNQTTEGQEVIAKILEVWAQSKEIKKLAEDFEKKSQPNGNLVNQTLTT